MKFILIILLIATGMALGGLVPGKAQIEAYSLIGNASAVIVGVAGAWYAVLVPEIVISVRRNDYEIYDEAIKLHDELLSPLVYGISIFSVSLFFRILHVPLYELVAYVHGLLRFHFSIPDFGYFYLWCLRLSFGVCLTLSGFLLWTVFSLLRPFDSVKTLVDLRKAKREALNRIGPTAVPSDDEIK